MLLYVFVRGIDKKNGIIDMVWSVGLDLRGDEFKLGLEQKGIILTFFFSCNFMVYLGR